MDTSNRFTRPDMQLSGSVAAHLREQIISGKLKTGDFLRIDSIANDLGVSTTPVREGLLLLQSESFVRLLPRRGFVVNSFSQDDLRDIFWAQAIVAGELAARAAHKMTKDGVAQMMHLLDEEKRAFELGDERVVRMGHEFHRHINLAAESPRLALLLGGLAKQLPNRFYASIEGRLSDTRQYHPIIADAIRMKDADAVRSLMYRHIMSGADQLIDSLTRAGIWSPSKEAANAPVVEPPVEVAKPRPIRVASGGGEAAKPAAKKGASVKKSVAAATGGKAKPLRAAGR